MARERYQQQVQLLVETLPLIMDEGESFALKGGTAINLFHRDLPRLSVDIDLVYRPIQPRAETIANIDAALGRIESRAQRLGARLVRTRGRRGDTRARIRRDAAEVKIDISPVMRGTVHDPEIRLAMPSVVEAYGFVEMRVVAFEDLFGGKLVAALDRQHPRDLFDVAGLYAHEGLTEDLWRTFLAYLAASSRPSHEVLDPNLEDLMPAFGSEFAGMTVQGTTLEALETTRERLISDVRAHLDEATRTFLLSVHDGEPDFGAIGLERVSALPAIRWKVENLRTLREDDEKKHAVLRERLEALFDRL